MKDLINKHKRKECCRSLLTISRRATIALIVIMLLSTVTIMNVDAFRIRFFNILTEWNDEYIQFRFEDNENIDLDRSQSSESSLETNAALYMPTYILEGYELLNIQETNDLYIALI